MTRGVKLYVEAVENDLIAAIEAGNGAGLCIAQDRAACNATNMTDTIERRTLQGPGAFAVPSDPIERRPLWGPGGFAIRRYYRQETPLGSGWIRGTTCVDKSHELTRGRSILIERSVGWRACLESGTLESSDPSDDSKGFDCLRGESKEERLAIGSRFCERRLAERLRG